MIATQTAAIFLDAYRELNAKKLFWITMLLSGLVVAVFGAVGIDKEGITLLWFRLGFIPVTTDVISAEVFYKTLFSSLGIGIWLAWIAAVLALVSTAGIVPDMVAGGAIETVLSKPISRTRLFLTKYFTGLLFVALQVGVFAVASFLVIGLRAGAWEPGLFLAIPIVVAFFSYLFCICALLGLLTRSTIAALLLTLLVWFGLFLVNSTDTVLLQFREMSAMRVEERTQRVELMEANSRILLQRDRDAAGLPQTEPTDEDLLAKNPFLARQRERLDKDRASLNSIRFWSGLVVNLKTVLPKTGETIALLERHLIDLDDITLPDEPDEPAFDPADDDIEVDPQELSRRLQTAVRERSAWWVVGTSLAFEAVILALCCLIFARRDF